MRRTQNSLSEKKGGRIIWQEFFGCQDSEINFHFSNYTRQNERNVIVPVLTLMESIVLSVSLLHCLSAQSFIDLAAFVFEENGRRQH